MEKTGLKFEREFVWGQEVLPGWSQAERRGVKYACERAGWNDRGLQSVATSSYRRVQR